MLRAGELRHLVELQEKKELPGRDEYGHQAYQWVTRARAWCKFEQLSASERTVANQQHGEATHKVTTRFNRSVSPGTSWRLKHKDRLLFIAAVNNVNELNEEWQFICGELKDA